MAGNPTVLLALAARAEAGGDATLSDDVWEHALGWIPSGPPTYRRGFFKPGTQHIVYGRPDLLTSIDAQAELPGRIVQSRYCLETENWSAEVEGDWPRIFRAPTEPLARLAAKLRALPAAQKESGDGE